MTDWKIPLFTVYLSIISMKRAKSSGPKALNFAFLLGWEKDPLGLLSLGIVFESLGLKIWIIPSYMRLFPLIKPELKYNLTKKLSLNTLRGTRIRNYRNLSARMKFIIKNYHKFVLANFLFPFGGFSWNVWIFRKQDNWVWRLRNCLIWTKSTHLAALELRGEMILSNMYHCTFYYCLYEEHFIPVDWYLTCGEVGFHLGKIKFSHINARSWVESWKMKRWNKKKMKTVISFHLSADEAYKQMLI